MSPSDFIDDNRIRSDRTYSSVKLESEFDKYTLKSNTYSKVESDAKYALKNNDHIHANMNVLKNFSESSDGKLLFGKKEILTDITPFVTQKGWTDVVNTDLSMIINMRSIYQEKNMKVIMNSEFLIRNTMPYISEDEPDYLDYVLRLVITEHNIVVLDTQIAPSTTQKYILGVSPDTKILVKGKFTANLCINSF